LNQAKKRAKNIADRLRRVYASRKVSLDFKDTFQLLIATILSAQCTDVRVNKVTPTLFKKYRSVSSFAKASRVQLEKDIHTTGFYRQKAKSIIGSSKMILAEFNGKVPDAMESLRLLPGVGRKTANIVLSSAFKKAEGIAVDTHVKRLSQRLGLSAQTDPNKIEQDLMSLLPVGYWLDFNYILVNHGRAVCKAQKPLCESCRLEDLCPSRGRSRR